MTELAGVQERTTARLMLRRPSDSDVPAIVALHVDPRNYPHSPGGAHSPARARAMAHAFIASWERDGIGYWLAQSGGEPVGMVGITPSVLSGRRCWNLYFRFTPAMRGRGLAAEAARESLAVAAELDDERPVLVRTRPGNGPARRLAEAIGLRRAPGLDLADGFVVYTSSW